MDTVADLVARIAYKARAQGDLPDPVPYQRVREAEGRLGFPLPPFLTALYTSVADGGFGPGTEVDIPGYDVGVLYPLETLVASYHENREPIPDAPFSEWPEGVVPMLNWGGFAEAGVDCLSAEATVLLYESDVDVADPAEAWKVDAPSLVLWWQRWLDGTRSVPTEVWHGRAR